MKKFCFLFIGFIFLALFTGCAESTESNQIDDIHDLVVPDGFSFETTKLIKIIASGPVTRTLFITNNNNELIYKGLLNAEEGFEHDILVTTNTTFLEFTYNGQVIKKNICPASELFYLTFTGNNRGSRIDSDGDTVPDNEDDWPLDPDLAYRVVYPPQSPDTTRCVRNNWSTLAFEDLWPQEGDYDFNDVIINYQIDEWLNYCSDIRHIYFDLYYSVDGAGYNDGFYIKVPFDETGVAQVDFPDSIPNREGFDYYFDTENGGDGNLVLRIFEEGHSFMVNPPSFHNTEAGAPFTEPFHFVLHVSLNDSQPYDPRPLQDYPPYNPFLVINQFIDREVHFANYPPTGFANTGYFGTQDDTSDPGNDRYYVTIINLPWAMHIPDLFDHPLERNSIIDAYPQFADWVTSGGTTNTDWFENPITGTVYDFVDQFNDFVGY